MFSFIDGGEQLIIYFCKLRIYTLSFYFIMDNSKRLYLILTLFLILPLCSMAQLPNEDSIHERGMMKNRANVDKESLEYQIGIIKDTVRFRKSLMSFVGTSLVYEDDLSEEDEDVEKENYLAPNSIHRKKADFSELINPIEISLVDNKNKKYYCFPSDNVRVTSRFGPRRRRYHYGIDLGLNTGDPIRSMFDGKVRLAKRVGAYGNLIIVEHDNDLETYYAHLSKLNVAVGDEVKSGEILGLGGSTGRSTGPHLHLEIRYRGVPVNPEDVIDFKTYALKEHTLQLTKDNFRHHSAKTTNVKLANNTANASKGGQYTKVRRGETLSSIARRNGTTVKKLAQLNNIKGSKIIAGQSLRIR